MKQQRQNRGAGAFRDPIFSCAGNSEHAKELPSSPTKLFLACVCARVLLVFLVSHFVILFFFNPYLAAMPRRMQLATQRERAGRSCAAMAASRSLTSCNSSSSRALRATAFAYAISPCKKAASDVGTIFKLEKKGSRAEV